MEQSDGPAAAESRDPVRVTNAAGRGRCVIVCEHASNWLPASLGTLGLDESEMQRHIAWDPGALPVARRLAEILDATLVESRVSRLAIDCNRPLDAPDLIPVLSETTPIPGNVGLDAAERAARIELSYRPFHTTLAAVIDERLAAGRETWVVTVHSFTPIFKGKARPWHVGIIHDGDERIARPLARALGDDESLCVGVNQPYSPADRVYFTLETHARRRGLACAMIEIRNDDIADESGQRTWAERLGGILASLVPSEGRGSPRSDGPRPAAALSTTG